MVTLYDDLNYLSRAVQAGAAGYVLKDADRDELVRAVRITAEGGAIIDPTMLPLLLRHMAQVSTQAAAPESPPIAPSDLTPRELEVLSLAAQGYTNPQIAEELILSPTTVKTHIQNILSKLGVSDRTQAAVYAVRHGLI
jgi:DNA-binding NarL/FixJ family response regulator